MLFMTGTTAGTTPTGGSPWMTIIMLVGMVLIFYFFIIRPQKKQEKQTAEMRNSISVGDEIVTIGGICGRIVSIKEDDVIVIETGADRTKLKMKSWCVSTNETAKARQAEEAAKNAQNKKSGGMFGKKKED